MTATDRRRFPEISSRAWEHPADRSALAALRRLTGFDEILRRLAGLVSERSVRLLYLATAVRASGQQFPEPHRLLREAADTLGLDQVPELYVTQDPAANSLCIGIETPVVVVTSGLLDLLDEDELRSVLGHELGHAISGHALYRTMLLALTNMATRVVWIPFGNLAVGAVTTALKEWYRKAELSSDRAGLLAGQDLDASLRALMKLAGGRAVTADSVAAYLEQAEEYDRAGDLRDGVLKLLQVLPQTHPFAVVRVARLHKWAQSEEYHSILAGAYPVRADDPETSVGAEWKAAAESYSRTVRESKDPLLSLLRDVGDRIQATFRPAGDQDGE